MLSGRFRFPRNYFQPLQPVTGKFIPRRASPTSLLRRRASFRGHCLPGPAPHRPGGSPSPGGGTAPCAHAPHGSAARVKALMMPQAFNPWWCLKPSRTLWDGRSCGTHELFHPCRCRYSRDSRDRVLARFHRPWLSHAHRRIWLRGFAGCIGSVRRTLARERGLASRKGGQAYERASGNLHSLGRLEAVWRGTR